MAEIAHKLEDGRGLIYLEGYCRNSSCSIREIEIRVKDHERTFLNEQSRLRCPVCYVSLTLHWVRTAHEHTLVGEQFARMNVNEQMYVRDLGPGLHPVGADVMCDDRLPPTPDGWFDIHKSARLTPVIRRQFLKEGEE